MHELLRRFSVNAIPDFLESCNVTLKRKLCQFVRELTKFLSVLCEQCSIDRVGPRAILDGVFVSEGGGH